MDWGKRKIVAMHTFLSTCKKNGAHELELLTDILAESNPTITKIAIGF